MSHAMADERETEELKARYLRSKLEERASSEDESKPEAARASGRLPPPRKSGS